MIRPFARRALVLALVAQAAMVVVGSPPARAATSVFGAVADATAYSGQPSTNFGSDGRLVADTSPMTQSFLRFEVAGLASAPAGAVLRLWVTDKSLRDSMNAADLDFSVHIGDFKNGTGAT